MKDTKVLKQRYIFVVPSISIILMEKILNLPFGHANT